MKRSLFDTRPAASTAAALVLAFGCVPALAALEPATFDEYVGIGGFSTAGVDTHVAESLSLTVLPGEWGDRGWGSGHAWIDPFDPVSTAVDLAIEGGPSPSGMGGTAFTRTHYEFTVVALDEEAPPIVDLLFSAYVSVSVASSQPLGPTSFSYGIIDVWPFGQFAVKNYDANGIYTGFFDHRWDRVVLGSFEVGATGEIDIGTYTHGEGAGADFVFDSAIFVDPWIEVAGPSSASYRIEYSAGIVPGIPEPATWMLLLAGAPLLRRLSPREPRQVGSGASSSRSMTASSSRAECTSSRA